MTVSFAGFLATEPAGLDVHPMAVSVFAVDEFGIEVGSALLHELTSVPVDGPPEDHITARSEADDLFAAGGWRRIGKWEPVAIGYMATVEHAAPRQPLALTPDLPY